MNDLTDRPVEDQCRPDHRGAADNTQLFAQLFVRERVTAFSKDMGICLTGIPSLTRPGNTHAYFPALGSCCGMLEYLSGLYVGTTKKLGHSEVQKFARFFPQDEYTDDAMYVLFNAFRHSVNHRSIASGIWLDSQRGKIVRRVTWEITELNERPFLRLEDKAGFLKKDPPWPARHTHIAHVNVGCLWRDIRDASERYLEALVAEPALVENFTKCMRQLYPQN